MRSVSPCGLGLIALSISVMACSAQGQPSNGSQAEAPPKTSTLALTTPATGVQRLAKGFSPDPHRVRLRGGGDIPAENFVYECAGFIAEAPDYRLDYRAGRDSLNFKVEADQDTSLLVRAPNGDWDCSNDGAGTLNPFMSFDRPQSGIYNIWIATLPRAVRSPELTLIVTARPEVDPAYDGLSLK